MSRPSFSSVLRELIDGDLTIDNDFNELIGHADVVRRLLEAAPASIRSDLETLHGLIHDTATTTGTAVLGIFPRLTNPELANVEGRISDYIAAQCGIRLDDGRYEAGTLVGESRCGGWPGIGSPLTNNRFPYLLDTSASNYFSNRFWHGDDAPPGFLPVPRGGKVVFRGEYLHARYFAFHPCDFDTNALPTLIDVDLEPDPGSVNPFRQNVPAGSGRRFSAQLVFAPPPREPEPNTTYVGNKRDGEPNQAVFNILRATGSDLGALPPNSCGVLLPSVTIYDAGGQQTLHFDECEPYPAATEPPVETTHFASLPIPDHRALYQPGVFNTKPNWGLPYDLLASSDILYVTTTYSRRWGEVLVLRAKAFETPHTPSEPVHTAGKQIRGFTVTNYNFWAGIAVSSLIDHQIARDEQGFMTLVVSAAENRPANATAENGVTWIDWGPYLDGQITFRLLLRRNPLLQALEEAINHGDAGDEVRPYVPKAAHCSRADFERGGWRSALSE